MREEDTQMEEFGVGLIGRRRDPGKSSNRYLGISTIDASLFQKVSGKMDEKDTRELKEDL